MTTAALKPSSKSPSSADVDAISLLKSDHKKVTDLFDQFEKAMEGGSSKEKGSLVKAICSELLVHTALEEQIFYPAVRKEIKDEDLMDEALVEHAGAKNLIQQLEAMKPGDEMFDAKVTVLGEYIRHHVKEEQDEMFPEVRKTDLDLDALGAKMLKLKQKLMENADSPSQSKPRTSAKA